MEKKQDKIVKEVVEAVVKELKETSTTIMLRFGEREKDEVTYRYVIEDLPPLNFHLKYYIVHDYADYLHYRCYEISIRKVEDEDVYRVIITEEDPCYKEPHVKKYWIGSDELCFDKYVSKDGSTEYNITGPKEFRFPTKLSDLTDMYSFKFPEAWQKL